MEARTLPRLCAVALAVVGWLVAAFVVMASGAVVSEDRRRGEALDAV